MGMTCDYLTIKQLVRLSEPFTGSIVLNVRYDVEKLQFLNRKVLNIAEILGTEFNKTKALGSQMKALSRKKEIKKVKFGVPGGLGRLRPLCNSDKSYVEITRPVRHFLTKEFATDIDICNCHLEFLQHLYEYYNDGRQFESLKHWNENREDIFQLVINSSKLKINRDDAKKLGFVFLYQGSADNQFLKLGLDKDDPEIRPIYNMISELTKECLKLSNTIKKQFPETWELLPYNKEKGKHRIDAGKFSSFMQNIERLCVTEIYNTATSLGFNVIDFCYDGVLVSTADWDFLSPEQACSLCNLSMKNIRDVLGLNLKVLAKEQNHPKSIDLERWFLGSNEMTQAQSTNLEIPEDELFSAIEFMKIQERQGEPGSETSTAKEMQTKKLYLEKYLSYIQSLRKFCFINKDTAQLLSNSEINTQFSNLRYVNAGKWHFFFNWWITQPDRREATDIQWIPYTLHPPDLPEGTVNIFTGFKHSVIPGFKVNMSLVQPWVDHIEKIWADNNVAMGDYIKKWFAHIVQFPNKKTGVNLFIKSFLEGAGKNILTDFISCNVLGNKFTYQTSDLDAVLGKFNAASERCLLLILDEASQGGSAIKARNRIKDMTTRVEKPVEKKTIDSYMAKDYTNMVTTTNEDWISAPSVSDRRGAYSEASLERVGNSEYFLNLLKCQTDTTGLHFWHYLLQIDLTKFNIKNIPVTNWKREMINMSLDPLSKTLISLNGRDKIHSQEIMDTYNSFCRTDRDKFNSVKSFNAKWSKYTGWPQARPKIDEVQKSGYILLPTPSGVPLVLDTCRRIRRDPDYDLPEAENLLKDDTDESGSGPCECVV